VTDLIRNFHSGDSAIVQGLTPSSFRLNFTDATGAFGPQLEVHASSNTSGGPNVTLAFAGYSTGDLANGRLTVSFSTDPTTNQPYMLVHAT
jgi:hypothetical protein